MESPFEIVDPCFRWLTLPAARLEQLWTGGRWTEGPSYFAHGNYVVWSDIPNDRMLQYVDGLGVRVFRHPSHNSNGNTCDREGRLITCEHGTRRVTRTEVDGSITILADSYQGKRLNSPNDVVVKSDGSIWFTDPPYGILSDYEGHKAESDLGRCSVFRIDPRSGALEVATDDFVRPNGLAFSPNERLLYISDSAYSHDPAGHRHIRVYDVTQDNRLVNGRIFVEISVGLADGIRLDVDGNLWSSAGDGVHCFDRQGKLLGKVHVPEIVSNLEFGGPKRNRLFITATSSLYAVYVGQNGAPRPHR